jgi:hypothetical protein
VLVLFRSYFIFGITSDSRAESGHVFLVSSSILFIYSRHIVRHIYNNIYCVLCTVLRTLHKNQNRNMASLLRNGNHTILRRCFINNNTRTINVTQRRSYHLTLRKSNAAAAGHHHYPPPMPPHARSPAAFEKVRTIVKTRKLNVVVVSTTNWLCCKSIIVSLRYALSYRLLKIKIAYGMMVLHQNWH